MNRECGQKAATRAMDVEEWYALTKTGASPPMKLKVVGNSMWPMIRNRRDTVTVLPCPATVQPGDIVLFRDERQAGRYVLHRVRVVEHDRLQTRGDGCLMPDDWIAPEAMLGIVSSVQRGRVRMVCDSLTWRLFYLWNRFELMRRSVILLRSLIRNAKQKMKRKG